MSDELEGPLGEWLRRRREELGISLEQAEADTRIRGRFLEAMEAEEFEALPDPIVTRGFLRNYAAYLELDPEKASNLYSELEGLPRSEPPAVAASSPFASGPFQPVPLHEQGARRSWIWWAAGFLAIILIALSLVILWIRPQWSVGWLPWVSATKGVPSAVATDSALPARSPGADAATPTSMESRTPAAWATTATPAPQATLTHTLTPARSPTLTATPTQPVYTGIFLELVFTDTAWIQVTVDGVRQFQGELEDGTYRSWYGDERIELRIGNAGAVQITINGQNLGALGEPGEVVDRVFEKLGNSVGQATLTPVTPVTPTEPPAPSETPVAATGSATITPTTVLPIETPTAGP